MEPAHLDARTVSDQTVTVETVTVDGVTIVADVHVPDAPRAAVVVCHPHPAYGGNRHHPVVDAVFRAAGAAGLAVARPEFRRVGADTDGSAETADVAAAIDLLTARVPAVPVFVVGYSFGAVVGLRLAAATGARAPGITGIVAVAAPLTMAPGLVAPVPTELVVPEHDQFCPPELATQLVTDWPAVTITELAMADHFLHGRAAAVAELATAWILDRLDEVPDRPPSDGEDRSTGE